VIVPPTDVMGRGRLAGIQDPTGGVVYLWKAYDPDESETYGEPGTLIWTDLETRDPQKAADFFSKLVGWEIRTESQGPTAYWQVGVRGQNEGGIMPMPDMVPPEAPAFWLDYFGTSDIDASIARAQELGGTVQVPAMEVEGMMSFAVLSDPAGATFALMQPLLDM